MKSEDFIQLRLLLGTYVTAPSGFYFGLGVFSQPLFYF